MRWRVSRIAVMSVAGLMASLIAGSFASAAPPERQTDQQQRQRVSETGEVVRTKTVALRGRQDSHQVVLLRTEDGQRRIVDLGPAKRLADLKIGEGDKLTVRGRLVQVGDHRVLMGHQVKAADNGQTVQVARRPEAAPRRQPAARQRIRGQQPKEASIRGTVLKTKTVGLRNRDIKHLVALVENQDGRRLIVDLGPAKKLADAKVGENRQISAQGRMIRVDGHQVLLARSVETPEDRRRIERPRMARQDATGPRQTPKGWVAVAADYDRDGRFDAYEIIFYQDLESARRQSWRRAQASKSRRDRPEGEKPEAPRQAQRHRRYSGEITSLRTTTFRGREGEYLMARIQLDDGQTKTVNLGSQDALGKLNLSKGDRITLLARPGRINERSALIAELVRKNGRTADVRGSTDRSLMR